MSSATPGEVVPDLNMILQSEGGEDFVLEDKLIPLAYWHTSLTCMRMVCNTIPLHLQKVH